MASLEESKQMEDTALVIFDLEVTFPRKGCKPLILEFGCIHVHPQGLYELEVYSTLVKPITLSAVTQKSVSINGITQSMVADARSFSEVADTIYEQLHGKVVIGHNIKSHDIPVLTRAFELINHRTPVFAGVVDTYQLVRASPYSRRAGDNTLDALSKYTGHGCAQHRAVNDCRTTLNVLKSVCARMYLETTIPTLFPPTVVPSKKRASELEQAIAGLSLADAVLEGKHSQPS